MINNQILMGALYACAGLLLIVLCIFLYLIVKRAKEQRRQQRMESYIERHEAQWYRYLVNNEQTVPSSPVLLDAVDRIFVAYMTTVNNKEVKERVSKYAALNMQSYYKKQFRHHDESVRMNVLQRTLLFDLAFLVPLIEERLKKARQYPMEEYLLLLRVIADANCNLFLAHMYKPRQPFNEYEYKVLLSNVDDRYHTLFKGQFETLPIKLRLSLLDLLSGYTSTEQEDLAFYERLLDSEYTEIRIRALKAISAFGVVSDLRLYETFTASKYWEERLMLARILRFITDEAAYGYLHQLMSDPHWQVRKQAAVSLLGMRKGPAVLQRIIAEGQDAYAAQMAREVMKLG